MESTVTSVEDSVPIEVFGLAPSHVWTLVVRSCIPSVHMSLCSICLPTPFLTFALFSVTFPKAKITALHPAFAANLGQARHARRAVRARH